MMLQIKHSRREGWGGKRTALSLSIVALILIFGLSGSVRSLSSDFFSGFFQSGSRLLSGVGLVPKFLSDKNKLIAENEKMSEEIESHHLDLIDYESLKNENRNLRETLRLKPVGEFMAAMVIARPPQIPLDSLFIDRGGEDGLQVGDLVLGSDRVLIGRIVQVSKRRATVALSSFAGVTSYGFLERTNEPLEVLGVGGSSLEVRVPIDFDIVVGDKMMTQGTSAYSVAVSQLIEEDSSSGFKRVLLSLPVNISKVNTVFIETQNNE